MKRTAGLIVSIFLFAQSLVAARPARLCSSLFNGMQYLSAETSIKAILKNRKQFVNFVFDLHQQKEIWNILAIQNPSRLEKLMQEKAWVALLGSHENLIWGTVREVVAARGNSENQIYDLVSEAKAYIVEEILKGLQTHWTGSAKNLGWNPHKGSKLSSYLLNFHRLKSHVLNNFVKDSIGVPRQLVMQIRQTIMFLDKVDGVSNPTVDQVYKANLQRGAEIQEFISSWADKKSIRLGKKSDKEPTDKAWTKYKKVRIEEGLAYLAGNDMVPTSTPVGKKDGEGSKTLEDTLGSSYDLDRALSMDAVDLRTTYSQIRRDLFWIAENRPYQSGKGNTELSFEQVVEIRKDAISHHLDGTKKSMPGRTYKRFYDQMEGYLVLLVEIKYPQLALYFGEAEGGVRTDIEFTKVGVQRKWIDELPFYKESSLEVTENRTAMPNEKEPEPLRDSLALNKENRDKKSASIKEVKSPPPVEKPPELKLESSDVEKVTELLYAREYDKIFDIYLKNWEPRAGWKALDRLNDSEKETLLDVFEITSYKLGHINLAAKFAEKILAESQRNISVEIARFVLVSQSVKMFFSDPPFRRNALREMHQHHSLSMESLLASENAIKIKGALPREVYSKALTESFGQSEVAKVFIGYYLARFLESPSLEAQLNLSYLIFGSPLTAKQDLSRFEYAPFLEKVKDQLDTRTFNDLHVQFVTNLPVMDQASKLSIKQLKSYQKSPFYRNIKQVMKEIESPEELSFAVAYYFWQLHVVDFSYGRIKKLPEDHSILKPYSKIESALRAVVR